MNMKRIILLFLIIIGTLGVLTTGLKAQESKAPVTISKGTFIKCISPTFVSTAIADTGDEIFFLNADDMYVGDRNIFPKNTKFYGIITDIKEPVQGTNASMKIEINKFVTPENEEHEISGYIYSNGNDYLGGELTNPAYYSKMPHYTQGWKYGVLQYAPTNVREMGLHTMIRPGIELLILIDKDLYLE